jgi:hypothetical protein
MKIEESNPGYPTADISKVFTYIEALADQRFWGNLSLKFQGGRVIHLVREESLKPEELIPGHRRMNGNRNI